MSSNESEKTAILRAWSTSVDDVAMIKDVATKGTHIDMCVEYLSKKRRVSLEESRKYFHLHVDLYVNRLLKDKLVYKAEDVLKNVGRNVEHVYYQFAHTAGDLTIKIALLDHLRKREPEHFDEKMLEYETYCRMFDEIEQHKKLHRKIVSELGVLVLEKLYAKTEEFRKELVVEVYFKTRLESLVRMLSRQQVWKYLVKNDFNDELLIWTRIFYEKLHGLETAIESPLSSVYSEWKIDRDMFEEALTVKNPIETLRNAFLSHGYLFPDEQGNTQKVLKRIFTSESFCDNSNLIKGLPLVKYIVEKGLYEILLEDFIPSDELETVKASYPSRSKEINLIATLKAGDISNIKKLSQLSSSIRSYLQSIIPNLSTADPTVLLFELLASNATIDELEWPENAEIVHQLPYLQDVLRRVRQPEIESSVTMEDFLQKFNNISIHEISAEFGDQPISFSNEAVSRKYAPKTQLNYCDYIRQNRSAFAVYCFLLDRLTSCAQISKSQLNIAVENVAEMILQESGNLALVASGIAFIEMLGFDTKVIRSYLKLKTIASQATSSPPIEIESLASLAESYLLKNKDRQLQNFPLREYSAIVTVARSLQATYWPGDWIQQIAQQDDWWRFLLFAQYFDIPSSHVKGFAKSFKTATIGEHMIRAFSQDYVSEKLKRRPNSARSDHRKRPKSMGDEPASQTVSLDTFTSSSSSETSQLQRSKQQLKILQQSDDKDLFAIIMLSSSESPEEDVTTLSKYLEIINESRSYCTSLNLMRNAIVYDVPVLAVLAAVVGERNVDWCWTTWLATAMGVSKKILSCSDGRELCYFLIEESIKGRNVKTLHQSFQIFLKDSEFNNFAKFLVYTSERTFTNETASCLRHYLLACSNNSVQLPLIGSLRTPLVDFSIKWIIMHMKYNFTSSYYRHLFLDMVCQSGINEIRPHCDFEHLKRVLRIIMFTDAKINFDRLIESSGSDDSFLGEFQTICTFLEDTKQFEKAIELATLLNLPISNIVYGKWIDSVESGPPDLDFGEYERETETYILPPEVLINFYLYVSTKDFVSDVQRCGILKRTLDAIKSNHLLPNEFFDRDTIEFEMVVCYLESDMGIEQLDIYHSKYYEKILRQERFVLYKSFQELKELAGVDALKTKTIELTENMRLKLEVLINRLLNDGDIVQALRLQAMFDYRPVDLHFVVFCMALAEGLTHISNLPENLREILGKAEPHALPLNKRVLEKKMSGQLDPSIVTTEPETFESSMRLEFEEIPSREKQEILKMLQGIVSRLKHGSNIGKRVMMVYRAAMHLDKEYLDVLKTKDTIFLLRNAIEEDCLEKLVVINDIFVSSQLQEQEIADFLAAEIATAVIRPRFYILNPKRPTVPQNTLWGFNLDRSFHLILELSANSILLGNYLLDYCDALHIYRKYQDNKNFEKDLEDNPPIVNAFDSLRGIIRRYGMPNDQQSTTQVLSHKKQNTIYVELLIRAHDCFVRDLSMEGIANVLNRAKILNSILTAAKSWNLIVRMLTGIGRYREMYYCIDTLISNDQFESLLGQFDEDKANGLRQALVQYISEFCPENHEYYRLTALHFSMHKELAEMWENEGNSKFAKIISSYQVPEESPTRQQDKSEGKSLRSITKLNCSEQLLTELNHAMENFTHATENYLMNKKMKLAQRAVAFAELAAMQIHLASAAQAAGETSCICVLNIRKYETFRYLVNNDLSVPQALILQRAYSYDINWAEVILTQYVLLNRRNYLEDFQSQLDLNDILIENIVKSFQLQTSVTAAMEESMSNIVELVQSVSLRYRLASLLGFRRIITSLINDQSLYYLKDTNYGRNDIDFS